IDIPGNTGVDMQIGDTLTIHYVSRRRFCVTAGNSGDFNPDLPSGAIGEKDSSWTGTAQVSNATITYSHVEWDKQCGSPNPQNTTPGTIKIGDGMK
ncbi:MAG: hypothetical protein WBX19_00135, partial [Terracidiphilus sp.]